MKQLPFKDRAADRMKRGMETWTALIGMITFILGWIILREVFHVPLDNPQLTILNLILSSLAGLQAFVILIAAKRGEAHDEEIMDKISVETDEIDKLLQENTQLTKEIRALLDKK